jgi:hypothetical protein
VSGDVAGLRAASARLRGLLAEPTPTVGLGCTIEAVTIISPPAGAANWLFV